MFAQLADHVADKRDTVNNNNTLPCPIPKRDFRVRFLARSYYYYFCIDIILFRILCPTSHIPVKAVFIYMYGYICISNIHNDTAARE